MLQKAAYKAVVNAFCRGMFFEKTDEGLIFHEKALRQLQKIRIFDFSHIFQELFVHLVDVLAAHGKIIRRIVLSLLRPGGAFDGKLQGTLEARHIAHHIDIVQSVKIADSR